MTLFINTCAFKKIIEVKLKLNIIFKDANSDIQQNNKEHYHKLFFTEYCGNVKPPIIIFEILLVNSENFCLKKNPLSINSWYRTPC